jgi:stage V sporulation protein R
MMKRSNIPKVDFDNGIITKPIEHRSRENLIFDGPEWTFELLVEIDAAIKVHADKYGLDYYPNQQEVITAKQMCEAYSSIGMPINYQHWTFGKRFEQDYEDYKKGRKGLAYEIVINSDPCIAYLMEENTMTMQALVIAHACYGHNSFFKGNYLFRQWTHADGIVDYLVFARKFIDMCEEKYGIDEVETLLDSCHALQNYGVDRYKHPSKLSAAKEAERLANRLEAERLSFDPLFEKTKSKNVTPEEHWSDDLIQGDSIEDVVGTKKTYPSEPQENILYFIEKNAPKLKSWQREIIRIIRKLAQYFYPQRQTQVMNEGWATFWHYTLMHDLYDAGQITDGSMIEFLESHCGVITQLPHNHKYFSGINVYALGYSIMRDIKRICVADPEANSAEQLKEDARWFPELVNTDWVESLQFAMRNFKDESFLLQYLSPKVIRDMELFAITDDEDNEAGVEITAIHDDHGYEKVRRMISRDYRLTENEPDIQVFNVDLYGDRTLMLMHTMKDGKPLNVATNDVLRHLYKLWGYDVELHHIDDGVVVGTDSYSPV